MSTIPCPVEGCSKDVYRGGFCYGHYMKNWRYGTPTPVHVRKLLDLVGQRFDSLTVTRRLSGTQWLCRCDCGASATSLTGDLRNGNAKSCGDRKIHARRDDAGYGAAHQRVRHDRGPADTRSCVECGEQAKHWSYNHCDPDERTSSDPRIAGTAYSLDPNYYSPRCVPCHKTFDLGRINAAAMGV